MGKKFRTIYTLMLLFLVSFYVGEHFAIVQLDRTVMFFPFLVGLIMITIFFCLFLVNTFFNGGFKIYDFLEMVGTFILLLIVQNAEENRLVFIGLLAVLLLVSLVKMSKKTELELE